MFGCEGVRAHDVVKSRRKPSGSIPRMTKQVVGICPECGAKNILPEPEPAHFRQVGNIPYSSGSTASNARSALTSRSRTRPHLKVSESCRCYVSQCKRFCLVPFTPCYESVWARLGSFARIVPDKHAHEKFYCGAFCVFRMFEGPNRDPANDYLVRDFRIQAKHWYLSLRQFLIGYLPHGRGLDKSLNIPDTVFPFSTNR